MRRDILLALAVAAVLYLAVCVLMFVFQRSLIYYPRPRQVSASESTMKLAVDGAELIVTVRPHPGPRAIVYFGGNAEDVSLNLASFSKAFPDHALYLMHYRGFGGSTGSPSEAANHSDAAALFRSVIAQHADISVIGRSLGSGVAVRLASEVPASRLILVTPFASLEDIAASAYPFVPVRLLLLDRYDSGSVAPRITVPTTIIAAEHDEVIPLASTEKLLSRFADGVAAMTVIQGAGHNSLDARPEYLQTIEAALAQSSLRKTPTAVSVNP